MSKGDSQSSESGTGSVQFTTRIRRDRTVVRQETVRRGDPSSSYRILVEGGWRGALTCDQEGGCEVNHSIAHPAVAGRIDVESHRPGGGQQRLSMVLAVSGLQIRVTRA